MSIYHMYTCMSPAVPHQFTATVGGQLWFKAWCYAHRQFTLSAEMLSF